MISPGEVEQAVTQRLASLNPLRHPVRNWPTDSDGYPLSGVAVEVLPAVDAYRMAGRRAEGVQRVRLHCVGATPDEALWVAHEARGLMDGFRVAPRAGTAREDSYDVDSRINPAADPQRVEVPLLFRLPV